MAEITNIQEVNATTFELQEYSSQDTNLISSLEVETSFNPSTDYVEYFIYNINGDLLYSNNFGFPGYKLLDNQISIDPETDIKALGFTEGNYNTVYNFLSNKLGSNSFIQYFISEISSDRTEVRLDTTSIPNEEVIALTNQFISDQASIAAAYPDFYLNFGNNQLVIANNILLDTTDPTNPTVLIKLYEALPSQFDVKTNLWVVEKIADPRAYNIDMYQVFEPIDDNIYLKGPNTNLNIKDQVNNTTDYTSYTSLSSTNSSQGSGSLQYQLNSLLIEKGIEINIDYSDYNQFIQLSSAATRLENFYYKLSLIEEYNYSASYSSGTTDNIYVSASNVIYQNKINELITGFDGYEYYLYFESGSACWPKSNTEPPYTNELTTSVAGQNWLSSQLVIAESFDKENNNALIYSIPEYLRDDSTNAEYNLFIEMIGQNFDNVWIYLKDVTNKFNADNRLNYGISKDLVADAIKDLGVKIYQNNFSSNDLYAALLGITPSGSLYNIPYTTGSLPTPEGWEYIDTYITASATGSLQPTDDINKSIYKRIYHNLPYLLKKKGTVEGLRALITLYGIPDTILRVNEFGGKDKNNQNDWDFWYNQFDYKYDTRDSGYVVTEWPLESAWNSPDNVPGAVEFRFKTPGLGSALTTYSQSLWSLDTAVNLSLKYTGSGYTSGSYSGSVPDPENEYANLVLTVGTTTSSVYLPFFDGGWWSVAVTRNDGDFTLFVANNIYTGEEGSSIGFTGSATFNEDPSVWIAGSISTFASSSVYPKFSGSLQEIRYYNQALSQSVFDDYVMNHNSIEGNETNTSATQLSFRASLGGELYTGSTSIHPRVTGSYITASFGSGNTFTISNGGFSSNEEYVYFDQVPVGIKNRNSNKIKQVSTILPYTGSTPNIPNNNTLSPFSSIQQNSYTSESYTRDIDYVEVAFSPQNEINDDIIDSIGYFNIGQYIGDPRQVSSSAESYPDLDALRNDYFEKYKSNYDLWDYIRLIKYLDNSLFKMLKDWTPARSSLAAGIVIKQHLLERNKYPVPQLDTQTTTSFQYLNDPFVFQNLEITQSEALQVETITGSNGGSFPNLEGQISGSGPGFNWSPITQSWTGSTPSLLGEVPFTQTSQNEFFDGELSGSLIIATTQSLNPNNPFLAVDTTILNYTASITASENVVLSTFLSSTITSGKIYLYFDSSSIL